MQPLTLGSHAGSYVTNDDNCQKRWLAAARDSAIFTLIAFCIFRYNLQFENVEKWVSWHELSVSCCKPLGTEKFFFQDSTKTVPYCVTEASCTKPANDSACFSKFKLVCSLKFAAGIQTLQGNTRGSSVSPSIRHDAR